MVKFHTDYQGSVVMVTDSACRIEQHISYYPYGEPHRSPEGQQMLYCGKERLSPTGDYDYGARRHHAPAINWPAPDPKASVFPWVSPYAFCLGNPIKFTDPNGCEIKAMNKDDADMVVEDLRAIFVADVFDKFRDLIVRSGKKQNGKSLAPISQEALSKAFAGVSLNEDQQALVDIVVNTINSKDVHCIEYSDENDKCISQDGEAAFTPVFREGLGNDLDIIFSANNGYLPKWLIKNSGNAGATVKVNKKRTHSIVITDLSNGDRAIFTGHEIFGHGRSLALGRGDTQNVDAVQTENLIRRVMGRTDFIDGREHGDRKYLPNHSQLPAFR